MVGCQPVPHNRVVGCRVGGRVPATGSVVRPRATGLRAVAAHSGVALATASRALSGSDRVSEATRQRVRTSARVLGYRPNAHAQALRTARSDLVGLVVTNLVNASFREIASVVQQRLAERGLAMVLAVTDGDPDAERRALRTLIDHTATGVIVVGADTLATGELQRSGLPAVHLARRPQIPAGDCVLGDDLTGARVATEHLLGLGHRRIAVIAGPGGTTSGSERRAGFMLAMEAAALPVPPEMVITGPFTADTGRDAVHRLWGLPARRRPTAVLVANHEASFGLLPALAERAIVIPDQLSVICFQDGEVLRWWRPAITVVDNRSAHMGELAATLLLARIDAAARGLAVSPATEYRVGTALIVRDSCAAPRAVTNGRRSPRVRPNT